VAELHHCRKLADGLDHPEAVALGSDGELYAGGEAGQVYRIDPSGQYEEIARVDGFVAGVTVCADGGLLVCDTAAGRVVKVGRNGEIEPFHQGESIGFPNFAAFDSRGDLFLTDSGDYYGSDGRLLVVHPNGEVEVVVDGGLRYPNGLAVHPSGEWLYLAQSGASDILRFPLSVGGVGVAEEYATIPGTAPDGLALAANGDLYVGCYTPDAIYRVSTARQVEPFLVDPWADLLNRPTNLAFGDGVLYYANLGGYHIGVVPIDEEGAPLFMGNSS
jgi:gluconolactonase